MERKVWRRPLTEVQKFEANEYVAACGDSGTTYYFKCDAGEPYTWTDWIFPFRHTDDHPYRVTTDNGRVLTNSYGPCNETHVAESDSEFLHGYIDNTHTREDEHIEVMIWTNYGTNVHCTTNLNQDSWETAKS
nr:hypothetical protein [uncultured Merdimonas sp.]